MTEEKLERLLQEMTLKEKIGQLTQLDVSCFSQEGPVTGPTAALGIREEELWLAGSILGTAGARETRRLQELCIKRQPHGIPLLFMADIINGYKTAFPIPLALGCSFDERAAEITGDCMAEEAACAGLHVTFSPMADLVRDARWGRVMESTGESPYLNSVLAAAMVRGIQGGSEPGAYAGHLGACTKHFAAYGAPCGGREYNTVELSERTLREDYLPAYQAAAREGSAMFMTSFNTLNRVPATADQWLLRGILREEMGFEGVLVSDWNAVGELVANGVARDRREAARLAIEAGVDMDMMSGCYMEHLQSLVEAGEVSEERINESVRRILTLKNRMGLFEDPYRNASPEAEKQGILTRENRKKARETAARTMVLLKNEENFLPLAKDESVAFIGPYTEEKHILGAWSFFADPQECVTLREGVERITDGAAFARGCNVLNPGQKVYGFRYHLENTMTWEETEEMIREAARLAGEKKKVVLALGESNLLSGEGGSRADITIPDVQKRLLDAVARANPNLAVLVFAGRPLDIRQIQQKAKSILYVWMPGTEGGNAAADLLYGVRTPEARLSMSLPYCVGQVPVYHNEFRTGRHTQDGAEPENRFLSKYTDIPNAPLYPFGFGLSYTGFSYSPVRLSKESITRQEELTAAVTVKNIGAREAAETVQLYLTDEYASVARPVRELKAFKKVSLKPGEEKEVSFRITPEQLAFYDIHMRRLAEPGEFTVRIGHDSTTENRAGFELL